MYQNNTLSTSDLHNVTCPIHPTGQNFHVTHITYFLVFAITQWLFHVQYVEGIQ